MYTCRYSGKPMYLCTYKLKACRRVIQIYISDRTRFRNRHVIIFRPAFDSYHIFTKKIYRVFLRLYFGSQSNTIARARVYVDINYGFSVRPRSFLSGKIREKTQIKYVGGCFAAKMTTCAGTPMSETGGSKRTVSFYCEKCTS